MKRHAPKFLALLCALHFAATAPLFALTPQEKLNAIVLDTQKHGKIPGRVRVVWWIPQEFWAAALSANGAVPADKVNEIVSALSDVNVFAVVDGKLGPLGSIDYASAEDIGKGLAVTDAAGQPLARIPEEKESGATKNLLAVMKPLLTNMLGEMGKNLAFFAYQAKDKAGKRLVDPNRPGALNVQMGEERFHWRLPLGSLLPARVCPKCGETFPGDYTYCPFDGTQLKEQPAEAADPDKAR